MSGDTILVTGAAGWIGRRVARLIAAKGHRVLALIRPGSPRTAGQCDRQAMTWLESDLEAPGPLAARLREDPPQVCVHCAWHTEPGRYLHAVENLDSVRSSVSLLAALRDAGCRRFVGLGTCFEYAFEGVTAPLRETARLEPRPLYAACKHAVHLIAEQMFDDFAWVRLFHLYGPGEARGRLVPHLLDTLLAGQPCPLTSGTQTRDYMHVDDAAAAIVAVALSNTRGAINVGSGIPVTVANLAGMVAELGGAKALVHLGAIEARPGDPAFAVADVRRLVALPGWKPQFDLRGGLRDMIASWSADVTR